jgi:hypothetical protein
MAVEGGGEHEHEHGRDKEHEHDEASVEALFAGQSPAPWWRQVTVRSVTASVFIGTVFSFMAMRMGLTIGLVPSFNMSASLVSFFVISSWTRLLLGRCGVATQPFTRQENVVVQTCVIACATLALYGGFTSFLPAMSAPVAKSAGGPGTGNNVYSLHLGKMMAFSFLTGFTSLFITLPLTKVTICLSSDSFKNKQMILQCKANKPLMTWLAMRVHAGHDHGLQAAVPIGFGDSWTCQQLPHASGRSNSKVI